MSQLDSLAKPRTLGVLLALSLGINLLLAGAIAGRLSAGWAHPHPPGFRFERGMRFMPETQREEMWRAMHDAMPDRRAHYRAMHKLHKQIAEELAKPEPDRTVLEKQLAESRAAVQSGQQALHHAFLDVALKMPVGERRAMIERMRHWQGGTRHRHGHHRPHPDRHQESFDRSTPPSGTTPSPSQ
jgi:uncharacterized membrane protein